MANLLRLPKVTAFILRPGLTGPQILAFHHPTAGLQLPAGTIDPGETPEAAVLREAEEESGLTRLRRVSKLGVEEIQAEPGQGWLLRSLRPLEEPRPGAAEIAQRIGRAWPVTVDEQRDDYAHVTYTECDLNHNPPVLQWSIAGWVPQADLSRTQVRHYYHLEAIAQTDPTWQQRADHGHIFRFEWLPLDPPPALIPPQDGWLRRLPAGPGPAQVIFEQGDLALRKLQPHPADYAALQRWLSDPRVLEFYAGRDQTFDLARVTAEFDPAAAAAAGETPCLIFYRGWAAGYLQFYPLLGDAARAEYGLSARPGLQARNGLPPDRNPWALDLFIGQPELWSRGLGTKLLNAFADWLFSNTPATELAVDPHADNLRAIRAYEKASFRRHKLLPAHELHEGKWVDCVLLVREKRPGNALMSLE